MDLRRRKEGEGMGNKGKEGDVKELGGGDIRNAGWNGHVAVAGGWNNNPKQLDSAFPFPPKMMPRLFDTAATGEILDYSLANVAPP